MCDTIGKIFEKKADFEKVKVSKVFGTNWAKKYQEIVR